MRRKLIFSNEFHFNECTIRNLIVWRKRRMKDLYPLINHLQGTFFVDTIIASPFPFYLINDFNWITNFQVTLYLGDLGYGSKTHRIQMEAEMIMNNESELLQWPCGVPTISEIDQAREMEEEVSNLFVPAPVWENIDYRKELLNFLFGTDGAFICCWSQIM